MAIRSAIANGNWSSLSTWDTSAVFGIPTASDAVFANGFNVNIDQSFTVEGLANGIYVGLPYLTQPDIAPIMTSNTSPSGICSASVNAATAWNAFDNNGSTSWSSTGTTGWISYQTITPNIARGYHIYTATNTTTTPRNWTFEGSNDGSAWTILDTRTSIAPSTNSWASYIPTTTGSFTYYRLNVTAVNGGATVTIFEFRPSLWYPATATGGSFIFNSGSISGSATSTTTALGQGAANLIQITAATGSVGLTLGSAVNAGIASGYVIVHSGNCDFRLSGLSFNAGSVGASVNCINKSSTGTIIITGSITGGGGAGTGNSNSSFVSSAGNTIVLGNVNGGSNAINGGNYGIFQSAGNVTVIGNVNGGTGQTSNDGIRLTGVSSTITVTGNASAGASPCIVLGGASSQFTIIGNVTGGTSTSAFGINHSGTSGSVIGNVTGGSGTSAHGINTVGAVTVTGTVTGGAGGAGIATTNTISVTGNVNGGAVGAGLSLGAGSATVIGNITAGTVQALSTATAGTAMTITGTATATATANAVFSSNTGTVNLTGNMINVSGRQAIFAQNLFISNAATSQWRLFTQGGQDKTLYSADTFPNQPTSANVRSGSLFGPANALSGSMVVPLPSDVRVNVLTDNTVGTGQSLTAADFLAAISSSADPFAERLRNVATVDTVGSLVTGLNGGF